MSSPVRILLLVVLTTTALAATAGGATADTIGPIRLLSKDSQEQASEAAAPAISADGNFVAFQGSIGGESGVFREEIATGAIVPVFAVEPLTLEGAGEEVPAIAAPSISADGRHVAFTTTARLDPADDLRGGTSDVYVADLATTPPTYELASAVDRPGTACPAGITQAGVGEPDGLEYTGSGSGSFATGRVALSADGREVVFVTSAESNLTQGSGGSTPGVATPVGQIVLRDLATGCSTLVSAERDPLTGAMTSLPVAGGGVFARSTATQYAGLSGASISADGSTVAWLGINLAAQVPVLADEASEFDDLAKAETPYDEPLWRRIGEGSTAPTRRIVGGGDPLAPGCPGATGMLAEPACQGPFPNMFESAGRDPTHSNSGGWLGTPNAAGVPQLSADGYEAALLGNPTATSNVFLVDMHPGLDRRQAVRQLTRQVPVNPSNEDTTILEKNIPENGLVFDLAISPDGEQIAFATARQQFPLAPPNLITAAPAGVGQTELYLVDLEGETLQRVTHGYKNLAEPSQGAAKATNGAGAGSISFGAGGRIAFASTAANLVEGDGNNAADVFLVEVARTPKSTGSSTVSPGPTPLRLKSKRLLVTAASLPNGKVRLTAFVPAAGRLSAAALGTLAVGAKARVLAKARAKARRVGKVSMTLALRGPRRRLAREPGGFYATARVGFHSRAGGSQERRIQVRFRVHKPRHKAKSSQRGGAR